MSLSKPKTLCSGREARYIAVGGLARSALNKYRLGIKSRMEMHAGCLLVSHVEYAPLALLTLERRRDRQTDGCQTVTLRLPLDAASICDKKFSYQWQL